MGAPPLRRAVVGTRRSALARAQTERVCALLEAAWPGLTCELRSLETEGDRTQRRGDPLPAIGGKGLFTAALEQALRAGEIDLAVHSLKDLPTESAPGVALGAVCLREDARDCLVARAASSLADLPPGAVVGTSSLRRSAQLRALRPDLDVRSVRGNVDTRVRKVREGELDAVLLAAAGIARLGLAGEVAEWLPLETVLPAPGQGALAVQCRADHREALALLAAIDDPGARAATEAERAFLRALGGGCAAPVAAYATPFGDGRVRLTGLVASPEGRSVVRVHGEGAPGEVGARLAREALAAGAERILAEIRAGAPLRGRRIAVTRPPGQAASLAARLEAVGAVVVRAPLVRIEPLEDDAPLRAALRRLAGYDWLVFTSANGVAAVAERLEGPLAGPRVAAVGPATAAALRRLGVEPSFVPERFAAEEVAAGLGPLTGARVLLPQADIADPALARELRRRGAHVDAVAAYRTVEAEPPREALAELARGVDAVVLASGSAARAWARLAGRPEALLVCIGPKTAAAAREVGLEVGLVADEATADGIVRALLSHYEEQST